ncbi:OmpA family protein [Wenzhouxiangella sp. AB-CW3]|nr:OmpA family protein [Wenzhouxiangella sp. AB-CW3]
MATLAIVLLFTISAHAAEDVAGSGDHPLVERVAGSYIGTFDRTDYDEVRFPAGPLVDDELEAVEVREGEHLVLSYYFEDDDTSPLRIFRNYEQALAAAGFETLYSDGGDDLGWRQGRGFIGATDLFSRGDRRCCRPLTSGDIGMRYLLAEHVAEGVTVSVLTFEAAFNLGPVALVDVVTAEEMEVGMDHAPISADEMQAGLVADGRVAVQNILFAFDSDEILPESAESLTAIAELMNEQTDLNLLVVGHTDYVGDFDYNLRLSMERASSVVDHLADKHGISRDRLRSAGAGMMSPITTNTTEEGQALNRRVELVQMPE